jgi:tocopherol cyclase
MTLRVFNDARYHSTHRRPFFEGWYFKHAVDDFAFAAIPGVFYGAESCNDHAFIQIIFSSLSETHFIRFPIEAFSCASSDFVVRIENNQFSRDGCRLSLPGIGLEAELKYGPLVLLKTSLLSPTIMGPFAYLPGMQCRHGVLSLWHSVTGYVQYGDQKFQFDGADGYIEKDWGGAFPDSWVWMQCGDSHVTLMCAVASIPLKVTRFTGVICVLRAGDRQYRFATYNGARVTCLEWQDGELLVELSNRNYRLSISAKATGFGHLQAPTSTGMDRQIQESLDACFTINMEYCDKEVLQGSFKGGLEMLGPDALIK